MLATCVVFVFTAAVGAVGAPVKAGDTDRTAAPVPVVPFERSDAANWPTVRAAPADDCLTTCEVPPVADKSVEPAGKRTTLDPAVAAARRTRVPEVDPLVIKPLSDIVTEVAVAAPSTGVTKVGDVEKTRFPLPVSLVTVAARLALVGVARKVAIPVARPEMPDATGRPVPLVRTIAEGVPRFGVVRTGLVEKTTTPVPVSSESTPASWAELVAANCDSGEPVTPHVGQAYVTSPADAATVSGEVAAKLVPDAPIKGPTVVPLIRTNRPTVVTHISPSDGPAGVDPGAMLKPEVVAPGAAVISRPDMVSPALLTGL